MNAMLRLAHVIIASLAALACSAALATVTIGGTRVIYPSDARDVSVRLSNIGKYPSLVQAWVDDGDLSKKPEELDVPFSVTPNIVRMDAGRNQVLRVVFDGADLPKDRETVYWLNVLEIPPRPDKTVTNYLQFSVRTRIKLFYRPTTLKGADKAIEQLKWSLPSRTADGEWAVHVENPTPFHVSFSEIKPESPDGTPLEPLNGMVPPFGDLTLRFKVKAEDRAKIQKLMFRWVNDFGGQVDGEVVPR